METVNEIVDGYKNAVKDNDSESINSLTAAYFELYSKLKETIKTKDQNFLPLFENLIPENIEKFDKEKINIEK